MSLNAMREESELKMGYRKQEVDDTDATYQYIGHARKGAAATDPVWRIRRITKATGAITLPAANLNAWSDRATLTYA